MGSMGMVEKSSCLRRISDGRMNWKLPRSGIVQHIICLDSRSCTVEKSYVEKNHLSEPRKADLPILFDNVKFVMVGTDKGCVSNFGFGNSYRVGK